MSRLINSILLVFLCVNSYAQLNLDWFSGTCPAHTGSYPFDMVLDEEGNGYACGYDANHHACIRKVDTSGNEVWFTTFDTLNGYDEYHAIVLDGNGNLYVTGTVVNVNYLDAITCKYDTSGNRIWTKTYNGPDMRDEKVYGLALTPSGQLLVIGTSWYAATNYDVMVISYDVNGAQNWLSTHNVWSTTQDMYAGFSIDAQENIYVGQNGGSVCSFDNAGNFRWATSSSVGNTAQALAGDKYGNSYLVGFNGAGVISKFDRYGNLDWDTAIANTSAFLTACIDSSCNFYAGGRTSSTSVLISFDSLKNFRWQHLGSNSNSQVTSLYARKNIIAFSGDGNMMSNLRGYIGALDSSGMLFGETTFLNPGANWSRNYRVAIDTSLTLRVTGQETYSNPSPCFELFVNRYSILNLTTGIEPTSDDPNANLKLYPNPTTGNVTIVVGMNRDDWELFISDMEGRKLFASKLIGGTNDIELSLTPGIYLATVVSPSSETRITEKLIIQ